MRLPPLAAGQFSAPKVVKCSRRFASALLFAGFEGKILSAETFCDVRIPSGYHNRDPPDLSPLALW